MTFIRASGGFGDAPEGPKAMTKKHSKKQLKQLSAEFLKGKLQELEAKVTPRLVERAPAESTAVLTTGGGGAKVGCRYRGRA